MHRILPVAAVDIRILAVAAEGAVWLHHAVLQAVVAVDRRGEQCRENRKDPALALLIRRAIRMAAIPRAVGSWMMISFQTEAW